MRSENGPDYKTAEPFEDMVRRLVREFSELERLRLDIQRAEEMLKARSKLTRKPPKNR